MATSPAGTTTISSERDGRLRQRRLADSVEVVAGLTNSGIDGVLPAAGHIIGTVKNGSGTGLAGVEVHAWVKLDGSWWKQWTATSAAGGAYDLGYLPTADYRLQFIDPSETYPDEWYANAATVEAADDVSVIAGQTIRRSTRSSAKSRPPPTRPRPHHHHLPRRCPLAPQPRDRDLRGRRRCRRLGHERRRGQNRVPARRRRLDDRHQLHRGGAGQPAGDGVHTISYRSTDVAGNTETAKQVTVMDRTPPVRSPPPRRPAAAGVAPSPCATASPTTSAPRRRQSGLS